MSLEEYKEDLYNKIIVLNQTSWENRINQPEIEGWLKNFQDEEERIHALFLLSKFMYFGSREMRELLKTLYRDLFKYPITEKIRRENGDSIDFKSINEKFEEVVKKTRFLGIGNPSESGPHLLYFFRQENNLSKNSFIHSHEIFKRYGSATPEISDPNISNYVFIDDFCGSGTQAKEFYDRIVVDLKALNPKARVDYLMLFATSEGLDFVIANTKFDNVKAVYTLNESFKCFGTESRYFDNKSKFIDKNKAKALCEKYGQSLMESICMMAGVPLSDVTATAKEHALGYKNGQLLIGFNHNTPDNTLPIVWYDEDDIGWTPIFKRYNKKYEQ